MTNHVTAAAGLGCGRIAPTQALRLDFCAHPSPAADADPFCFAVALNFTYIDTKQALDSLDGCALLKVMCRCGHWCLWFVLLFYGSAFLSLSLFFVKLRKSVLGICICLTKPRFC